MAPVTAPSCLCSFIFPEEAEVAVRKGRMQWNVGAGSSGAGGRTGGRAGAAGLEPGDLGLHPSSVQPGKSRAHSERHCPSLPTEDDGHPFFPESLRNSSARMKVKMLCGINCNMAADRRRYFID